MNYANYDNSERLKRTAKFLRSNRRWLTTRDIIRGADVCAVNSVISELRSNGFKVECRCKGRGLYQYRYMGRAA